METINNKQAICMMAIFVMGSTLIIGTGGAAKNDTWIAIVLGFTMALPVVFMYARILTLFKGINIYDIVQLVFGKVIGKAIVLIYTWYAFHLGAMVLRNFGEFINTVAMPETPIIVPMLLLGMLCIMVVEGGIEVLGRVAKFLFPVIIVTLLVVNILGISNIHPEYIKPIFYNGLAPVAAGAFSAFSFPFAETILFTTILAALQPSQSVYKVYLYGLLIGAMVVLIISTRNIMVLSPDIVSAAYFPSHISVSRISIGNFLQRIEVTVATVLIVTIFIKASVCLYAACLGVSKIFGLPNHRTITTQMGLLMIYFSYILYDDIIEMTDWAFKVYAYYAFPFQVIIPLIILIAAEIRIRRGLTNNTITTT